MQMGSCTDSIAISGTDYLGWAWSCELSTFLFLESGEMSEEMLILTMAAQPHLRLERCLKPTILLNSHCSLLAEVDP